MHPLPLQLPAGSDPHQSLARLAAEQGAEGFVVSAVGNLAQACLRFPGQRHPAQLPGELEIISLSGSIRPDRVHLHMSVSDGLGRVVGGHLEPGSRVASGAELLIALLVPSPGEAGPRRATQTGRAPSGSGTAPTATLRRVELAVLPGCPYSARALRMLRTLGIPHSVQEIRSDSERRALRERSGQSSLPLVFIDGEAIGGYSELADLHGSGTLDALRAV
jgi:predicted DNA-binding protein with PD1-like motif/glutaredoxin